MRKPPGPNSPNEDDAVLFAEAMAGVKPLPRRGPPPVDPSLPPAPARPRQLTPARQGLAGRVQEVRPLREIECRPEAWGFLAHDAGPDLLRELRAGRRPPASTLDLHGMKAAQAERALVAFVTQAHHDGQRVLLVVHGRGLRSGAEGPVLRELVRARVVSGDLAARLLAFSHAPAAMGGVGASLLLLRKR